MKEKISKSDKLLIDFLHVECCCDCNNCNYNKLCGEIIEYLGCKMRYDIKDIEIIE